MKKFGFIFAAAVAAVMASCGNGTPKADLKSEIDSLSYAVGMAQTRGLKDYLSMQQGIDTTYMDEFVKGLNDGANAGEDKKKAAYYAGVQIGQTVSQRMVKGLNMDLFGEDSTQTVSLKNILAGFIAGTLGKGGLMDVDSASTYFENKLTAVKRRTLEKTYADNKKACEDFMAQVAKKEGIKALDKGVYYEVLTEGKGAIPADTNRVKVHYEGRLINDSIFDSSYKRNEPATFMCNAVIPGWTNALTHMPVGSKWKVYIPQDQAYAEREAGIIKPFSCLIFTIDLLGIEKDK